MYKVICPIERRDGGKFWMRVGSAFTNKDDSINIYLDAVPTRGETTLQLRELTEEELRAGADKRASYASARPASSLAPSGPASTANLPF
jgi:hypothetical protein